MKKIIFILVTLLIMSCCSSTNDKGYGYGMSSSTTTNVSSGGDIFDRALERRNRKTMYLYDTKGTMISSCSAYKGKFDGHSWYVFYDNLATPSVVHDPLCECIKK